jgi:hypothetical protein
MECNGQSKSKRKKFIEMKMPSELLALFDEIN